MIPNKKKMLQFTELLSVENVRSIASRRANMPVEDNQGMITLKSSELEGSFETPCKGDSLEFYRRSQFLHYVLNFTDNIGILEEGSRLVISVQTAGSWSFLLQEKSLQLYNEELNRLNRSAAENFCSSRGGHLASVGSQEEQDQIEQVA